MDCDGHSGCIKRLCVNVDLVFFTKKKINKWEREQ